MARAVPRYRTLDPRRPDYLPTSVQERLSRSSSDLPADRYSSWETQRLAARGVDVDFINALVTNVKAVRMELPTVPVPTTVFKVYHPDDD